MHWWWGLWFFFFFLQIKLTVLIEEKSFFVGIGCGNGLIFAEEFFILTILEFHLFPFGFQCKYVFLPSCSASIAHFQVIRKHKKEHKWSSHTFSRAGCPVIFQRASVGTGFFGLAYWHLIQLINSLRPSIKTMTNRIRCLGLGWNKNLRLQQPFLCEIGHPCSR